MPNGPANPGVPSGPVGSAASAPNAVFAGKCQHDVTDHCPCEDADDINWEDGRNWTRGFDPGVLSRHQIRLPQNAAPGPWNCSFRKTCNNGGGTGSCSSVLLETTVLNQNGAFSVGGGTTGKGGTLNINTGTFSSNLTIPAAVRPILYTAGGTPLRSGSTVNLTATMRGELYALGTTVITIAATGLLRGGASVGGQHYFNISGDITGDVFLEGSCICTLKSGGSIEGNLFANGGTQFAVDGGNVGDGSSRGVSRGITCLGSMVVYSTVTCGTCTIGALNGTVTPPSLTIFCNGFSAFGAITVQPAAGAQGRFDCLGTIACLFQDQFGLPEDPGSSGVTYILAKFPAGQCDRNQKWPVIGFDGKTYMMAYFPTGGPYTALIITAPMRLVDLGLGVGVTAQTVNADLAPGPYGLDASAPVAQDTDYAGAYLCVMGINGQMRPQNDPFPFTVSLPSGAYVTASALAGVSGPTFGVNYTAPSSDPAALRAMGSDSFTLNVNQTDDLNASDGPYACTVVVNFG